MWLATRYGFYSIVQKVPPDDGEAAVYHVRARIKKDLENLLGATALEREIVKWPGADYRYRFIASAQDVMEIMSHLAESLDYDNFKAAIGDTPGQREKLPAYHEVWRTMADLQR